MSALGLFCTVLKINGYRKSKAAITHNDNNSPFPRQQIHQQHHELIRQLPLLHPPSMHRHQRPRRLLRRIFLSPVVLFTLQDLPPLRTILRPRLRPHLDARPSIDPHRRLSSLRCTHLRWQSLHEGPSCDELPPFVSHVELLSLPLLLHRGNPHRTPTLPQSDILSPTIKSVR